MPLMTLVAVDQHRRGAVAVSGSRPRMVFGGDGLAAAGLADDGEHLAAVDREADVRRRPHAPGVGGERRP